MSQEKIAYPVFNQDCQLSGFATESGNVYQMKDCVEAVRESDGQTGVFILTDGMLNFFETPTV